MKTISPVKFTLATFAFTWLLLAIAILSGQSSKDFPNILFYIIGGCGPSLVAIFFVWRNFNSRAAPRVLVTRLQPAPCPTRLVDRDPGRGPRLPCCWVSGWIAPGRDLAPNGLCQPVESPTC